MEFSRQAWSYIRHNKLPGDYLEFGVFQGKQLFSSYMWARRLGWNNMNFYGFDCFAGLPDTEGVFRKGEYACSIDKVRSNLKKGRMELNRLILVEGLFKDSLPKTKLPRPPAMAYIDCDLYSSTTDVLKFLTQYTQDGMIIAFDDWWSFKGRNDQGERRACEEWLRENPQLSLEPFWRIGWCGQAFVLRVK